MKQGDNMPLALPAGFIWGTATASYQIEGAVTEDGRGPSIWDTFSHIPGKTLGGDTGDIASDHYHRWQEDLGFLSRLGVGAYRFSAAWPRIQPTGSGPVNQAGLDFYDRLVDGLLERGIRPYCTLYHWDLPQALGDAGGWLNRDTAFRLADYATILAKTLGDRIDTYTTLNEPWCSAFLGYASGSHAPGLTDAAASLKAAHHLNLAHGLAAQATRSAAPGTKSSITLNLHVIRPATDSPEDADAVRQVRAVGNEIFLQPILEGRYPADLLEDTKHLTDFSFVLPGDLELIHQPLDSLGINFYSTSQARRRPSGSDSAATGGHGGGHPWAGADNVEFLEPAGPLTSMGWNIDPGGLTEVLTETARRYPGLDLVVTENGSAFYDDLGPDGSVHDPRRVAYLEQHTAAVAEAVAQGAPVVGYFVWSLLDNFEWSWGFDRRFGLIYVDYANGLERHWKDSAERYRRLIAENS
jgi:beta-glucosidase